MKKLLFILSGFLIQAICKRVQVTIGKDIDLHCQRRKTVDDIWKIVWKKTESRIFICNEEECADNESRHSFAVGDHFRSTLHIKNVSLNDDGEYTCTMSSVGILSSCEIHLTVNVPPTGLILVDKDDGELLQSNGSFRVAEGENKTLICKTNTSVKPAVNLEWVFPNGLLDGISEHGDTPKDKQDGRLFVPKRTLSFTPNYTFGEDIFLTCKVDNYSSFEHIKTSIYIKKELGALTTTAENPRTSSEENQGFTRTAGTHKGSDALTTSVSSTSTKENSEGSQTLPTEFRYIAWSALTALIIGLLVLAVRRLLLYHRGKNEQTSDLWIRTFPQTPTPQPSSSQEAQQGNLGTSDDANGEFVGVSEANEALGNHPIQKGTSFSHVYMEMKPVNNPSKSSPSFSANVNVGEHPTSHAPRTKNVETDKGSQKDQAKVNSENAFHKIHLTRSQSLDSVCTTYI